MYFSHSIPHSWENCTLTHCCSLPCGSDHCWLFLSHAVLPQVRTVPSKIVLTSPMYPHFFSSLLINLDFPSEMLVFYKISLVNKFLPKSALFRFFPTTVEKVWGSMASFCLFCSPQRGLSVITKCIDGWDFSWGLWHVLLHIHIGMFTVDWWLTIFFFQN